MKKITDAEFPAHFWSRVDRTAGESGCWLWSGSLGTGGYGLCGHQKRVKRSHRIAWELTHGPIPDGMVVCHRCDNPPCCNPAHLFLGTLADNVRDMVAKGRNWQASVTECPQGHSLSGDNLYTDPAGRRVCKACIRAHGFAYRARHREEYNARRRGQHDPVKAHAKYLRRRARLAVHSDLQPLER
jgi:hypothetical protein